MSIDSRSDSNSSAKGKGSRLLKKPLAGDVAGAFRKDIGKLGDITRNFGNTIQSVLTSGMKKDTTMTVINEYQNSERSERPWNSTALWNAFFMTTP